MDDDDSRWPNNANQLPQRLPTIWFFGEEDLSIGYLRFSAVDCAGQEICTLHLHLNLALALAYLDIDYWTTNQKQTSSWNQMRIQGYLLRVREDVVKEMMAADAPKLLHSSFETDVLRQWAIRVHYGCGHSFTGRKAYSDFCALNRINLYDDDFINYGEGDNLCDEKRN